MVPSELSLIDLYNLTRVVLGRIHSLAEWPLMRDVA
jgi:hypothetical protein